MLDIKISNASLEARCAYAYEFKTQESLSEVPQYDLYFETPCPITHLDELLGQKIAVQINWAPNPCDPGAPVFPQAECKTRNYYELYIVGCADEGFRHNNSVYKLELSSWLWFLQKNRNSRIFQEVNALAIIEKVFAAYGCAAFRFEVSQLPPLREYCVQFAETDLCFIHRLLEDEGIWYYFLHENCQQTLVISDRQDFRVDPHHYLIPYLSDGDLPVLSRGGVQQISRSIKIRPNEIVLRDFDYLHPRNDLQSQVEETDKGLPGVPLAWYDYAAGYKDTARGESIARLRLEMMQSQAQLIEVQTDNFSLRPGFAFTLYGHINDDLNRDFKVVASWFHFRRATSDSSTAASCHDEIIHGQLRVVNQDIAFRPQVRTPKPAVPGLQSATVVGAPLAEVHTDCHARIRVHFHWDRFNSDQEHCSCWVRVAQAWAGKGWGVVAMPRVGQEVLITYVDGNLDRPMVTGIVYNGDNPPPYNLPQQSHLSGIVSRSLNHSPHTKHNEITLDDACGQERVKIHAERDYHTTVEHNMHLMVANNRYDTVVNTYRCVFNYEITSTEIHTGLTGIATDTYGIATNITGIKNLATGIETSITGVNTNSTGLKTSFTGAEAAFTGIRKHFTAADSAFTGLRNHLTGMHNGAIGVSNDLIGVSNAFTGVRTSFTGEESLFTLNSNALIGNQNTVIAAASQVIGTNAQVIGVNSTQSGSTVNTHGAVVNNLGVLVENIGAHVVTTGGRVSTVGRLITNVGCEIKNAGMECKN